MKRVILAASITLASLNAAAQSSFEGFYGQVGIGYQSVSPSTGSGNIQTSGGSYSVTSTGVNSSNSTGTVGVGYLASVTGNFLLGIGAEYSPIKGATTNTINSGGGTGTYQVQSSYAIFLAPAVSLEKDKLLYAKVGFASATTNTKDTLPYDTGGDGTFTNQGYILGLGYKQIIKNGFYGFVEGNYSALRSTNYGIGGTNAGTPYVGNNTTGSINAYNFLVGVGYKF
jgi:outer membrane immunogenic protein